MRRKTTKVRVGNLMISSEHPVIIQSMLNTATMDTEACVEQAVRIIEAGGELVRITAQGVKEAENLKNIHTAIRNRGYDTPLSADIHFTPDAAMIAARHVEKVRINPGNFVDKRATFKNLDYTDEQYAEELRRQREKFTGFLEICRENNTAIRIGTNHGSLSDRIMSRYGNTPAGMVEATMEYLRICQETGFDNVVISLKSSDCKIMVDAVRLLVVQMQQEQMDYPLHLGVTEAGEGEDGRIRSAIGIGTLLNEGIGDTIRVSLTEAPEAEIPVAKALVRLCNTPVFDTDALPVQGIYNKPVIVADLAHSDVMDERISGSLDFFVGTSNDPVYGDRLQAGDKTPEIMYTEALGPELTKLPGNTMVIVPQEIIDMAQTYNRKACPLYSVNQYLSEKQTFPAICSFLRIDRSDDLSSELFMRLKMDEKVVLVLSFGCDYHAYRNVFRKLASQSLSNKVILQIRVNGTGQNDINLSVAASIGRFFLDRMVYGIWIITPEIPDINYTLALSRNILQSAGLRRYKTEFVSCPGCGRTLFNLQEAVAKVKQAFSHLNTLKIAVMGCVVNGPGEMGDADYGYVGAGNGKVNFYKGKQIVKIAIPESEAIAALKQLIIDNNDWKE